MLEADHARLEILKVLIPAASRHGISEPERIIETARALEQYVLESPQIGEVTPDSPSRRGPGRPRKEKHDPSTPEFLTPPMVDKSNQAPG